MLLCHLPKICLVVATVSASTLPQYEYQSLSDFYYQTNGDYWSWNSDPENFGIPWIFSDTANPCTDDWQGITCSQSDHQNNQFITSILLSTYNITGTIPASIGNFSQLQALDFSNNFLYGTIPLEIIKLQQLTALLMGKNMLTGTIPPELGDLNATTMTKLDLYINRLNGTMPSSLSQLTGLHTLKLFYNQLHGTIPAEFGRFSKMVQIELYQNDLTGILPPELSGMVALELMLLQQNRLEGSIPAEFAQILSLRQISMDYNRLTGTLPVELSALPFDNLYLGGNRLTGTIPPEYGRLAKLNALELFENFLNGTIPAELGQLLNLNTLSLFSNQFSGTIPPELGQLSDLYELELNSNDLTGRIPAELGNLMNLLTLNVYQNRLSHGIPDTFGKLTVLQAFTVSDNELTGTIPVSLCSAQLISTIWVNNNLLSGSIPECFVTLYNLISLAMESNALTGTIPHDMVNNRALSNLLLNENHLTGSLPEGLGALPYLVTLTVDNNLLSGILPQHTSDTLTFMYVSRNFFSGTLPAVLCTNNLVIMAVETNILTGTLPAQMKEMSSLDILFMYNNHFSGNLDSVFDATTQINLAYIDMSNNQLTGSVPVEAFRLRSLLSFAAVSNCLSGTIPSEICAAVNLTTFALDGMKSASGCQNRFFPAWTGIQSYSLSVGNKAGSVPSCLYSMPLLETLHLSGNGLTGTIPSDVVLGDSLRDLSLSHNLLTGDLPVTLHHHAWTNLDLSFNKLGGTLSQSMHSLQWNASVALNVNRLSGKIPSALQNAEQISILDGNLFECDASRSELPVHDSYVDIYECGSNTFNYAMYVWVGVLVCVFAAAGMVYFGMAQSTESVTLYHVAMWARIFVPVDRTRESNASAGSNVDQISNIKKFGRFMSSIRWSCLVIVSFALIVLMPTFATLSSFYDTYVHEYAWTVSASYISGTTATAVMFVSFVLYGVVFVAAIRYKCYPLRVEGGKSAVKPERWSTDLYFKVTALVLWDLVLVTGVNIAYVYIDHNYKAAIVRVTQLSVALFKVVWNGHVVQQLLKLTSVSDGEASNRPKHIALAVFVILFNNIAAPFVATAYVSSNCFYNVVAPPPQVQVSYTYMSCINSARGENISQCFNYAADIAMQETSYDPPFMYSYHCSSTFVTTYASVYVLMFTIEAFFTPLLLWVLKVAHTRSTARSSDSYWHKLLTMALPSILKPLPAVGVSTAIQRYFACDAFIVKLVNLFAILSTFGVILPPVAAVCCVTMFCVTYHTQLLIGRLVTEAQRSSRQDVLTAVDGDCSNAVEMFGSAVWIVIPFAAVFYSLFLFDTLGDAVGWREALWAPLLMLCLPAVLWTVRIVNKRRGKIHRNLTADGSRVVYSTTEYSVLQVEEDGRESGSAASERSSQLDSVLLMDSGHAELL